MNIKYLIVVPLVLTATSCWGSTNKLVDELLKAVSVGNIDQVKQILKNGANVNATGAYGSTALIVAADMGHEKLIPELLILGAHIDQTDKYGRTALMWAADRGHGAIVDLLIKANADSSTALKKTVDNYDPSAAKLLIEHHANTLHLTQNQKETLQKWGLLYNNQNDH